MESIDKTTNMVLKYAINDRLEEMNFYVNDLIQREYKAFQDSNQIECEFESNVKKIYEQYSEDDIIDLRYYTGTSFKEVNAVLRDNWNYEINGKLTEDNHKKFKELASNISGLILSKGSTLNSNVLVYRGVNLNAFKKFGVGTFEDLLSLKGQYIYDSGFVSTSLIREKSFFGKGFSDIEIEYLIPNECLDGIPLITSSLSYYDGDESEFLINSGSLSRVIDVKLSEDKTKAYVKMAYIPKFVWDKQYGLNEKKVSL